MYRCHQRVASIHKPKHKSRVASSGFVSRQPTAAVCAQLFAAGGGGFSFGGVAADAGSCSEDDDSDGGGYGAGLLG